MPLPSSSFFFLFSGHLRRRASSPSSCSLVVWRLFCSLRKLKNISYRHRPLAISEAQRALTDYLHSTRCLPFLHADLIASHSPSSLNALVSQVPFPPRVSAAEVPRSIRRFLAYRPVNEFEFFFESIGVPTSSSIASAGASRGIFLSDDRPLLNAVSALVHFGFPWTKLGLLYHEVPSIFSSRDPEPLVSRLDAIGARGLRRVCAIGVCLAFPSVLAMDAEPGGDVDLLFRDLRTLFVDFKLEGCIAEDNVDGFLEVARRVRVFYDVGSEKGTLGQLMGREKWIFLELNGELLAQKLNFFARLGMEKEKIGAFLLQCPETLNFDLDNPSISIPEYLERIGLGVHELNWLSRKYPYVIGRNKLGNFPSILRAVKLHKWFLNKILTANNCFYLSSDFISVATYDIELEQSFLQGMDRLKGERKEQFIDGKLEFLLGVGFGENKYAVRALSLINGMKDPLQERFNCLLELGVEYSMLCRMINAAPKLLNQSKEMLQEKVKFLCDDLGFSIEYLDTFPAFLCFDLENRIKPRYKILNWLRDHGLLKKPFAPATVLANSERRFMVNLYSVHPAAPKQWLECFSARINSDGNQKILFLPRPESRAQG